MSDTADSLAIAVAHIDEVIRVIRSSKDAATAREELMSRNWPAAIIIRQSKNNLSGPASWWLSAPRQPARIRI